MNRPDRPPGEDDRPPFAEPWQAEAFALAVALHARGAFAWDAFASALGAALKARAARLGPDQTGEGYYEAWLDALEHVSDGSGMTTPDARAARRTAWLQAYARTPHGHPVRLSAGEAP